MNRTKGIHGLLNRVDVAHDAFGGHVEVMEVSRLRFHEEGLHVKEPNHAPVGMQHPVSDASGCASSEQSNSNSEQTH